jgi:hypothetical protein
MSQNVNFILSDWTYSEYNEFLNAFSQRDFRGAGYLVEKVVADWSAFEDVPTDALHPIDHLTLEDATAVIHALQSKTKEYTDALDIDADVTVDLSKWKWHDFNVFQELVQANNIDKAIEMMLQVARLKKGHPKKGQPLNAVQGIVLFAALTDKIRRVFSGGN